MVPMYNLRLHKKKMILRTNRDMFSMTLQIHLHTIHANIQNNKYFIFAPSGNGICNCRHRCRVIKLSKISKNIADSKIKKKIIFRSCLIVQSFASFTWKLLR